MKKFLDYMPQMQQKIKEMQDHIANTEYCGKAGGELVNVVLNGRGEMCRISIDPSLLKVEEKEMLEDLIRAAHNDAKNKIDEDSQKSMSNAFANIGIPPGFKMPF